MLKIKNIMIGTAILLVLALSTDIHASKHQSQLWSFTFENISVKDALLNIREQAGVDFSIDEDIVEGELSSRAISKFYADKPLELIITDIFRYDNCAMTWSYRNERLSHVRIWIFQTARETGRAFHHCAPSQMMRLPALIAPGSGPSAANFKAPVRSNPASFGNRKRPMRSKAGYHQPSAASQSNASVVSDSPAVNMPAGISYPSNSNNSGSSSYVSDPTSNNSGSSTSFSDSSGTDETTTGSVDPDAQTHSAIAPPNAETSSDSLDGENPTGASEEFVLSDEQQVITETENPESEPESETAFALLDDMQIEITLSKYLYGLE